MKATRVLRSAVELRLGKIRGGLAEDFVGPPQLLILPLQFAEPVALLGGQSGSLAVVTLSLATQFRNVWRLQPIFEAIDVIE